jgi:hypothetical protein
LSRASGSSGGYPDGIKVSEVVRGVLVLLVAWAIITLGVFISEGTLTVSAAIVLAGVLALAVCLFLLVGPHD